MTENIKIYRNINPRLGFIVNETSISNIYVDQESLRKLISYINHQFLICSNLQSQCLLTGCVDQDNTFITILCIGIVLPLFKSILFNSFQYLFAEYLLIFCLTAVYLFKQFSKSQETKQKYIEAQEQLQRNFAQIQKQFNSRFDYLQMEYIKSYDQNQEDYLEIKVKKVPSSLRSLEDRIRNDIKLIPIQE